MLVRATITYRRVLEKGVALVRLVLLAHHVGDDEAAIGHAAQARTGGEVARR